MFTVTFFIGIVLVFVVIELLKWAVDFSEYFFAYFFDILLKKTIRSFFFGNYLYVFKNLYVKQTDFFNIN